MSSWKRRKNYEKNNLSEKKNYAWKKLSKSKGSLTETWQLKSWKWNKKLKG